MSMSKIIYGKRGCGLKDKAVSIARKTLCLNGTATADCNCRSCQLSLNAHPDFALFDQSSYTVEDMEEILAFGRKMAIIADYKVIVILNMGAITEESQNKLLKDIEDNERLMIIGTAYENRGEIISTIKSRTQRMEIYPLSKEDFLSSIKDEDVSCLYAMTEGCPGLVDEMRDQIPIFKGVLKALETADARQLLVSLHLVEEKDKEAYCDKYKQYLPNLFSFIEQALLSYLYDTYPDSEENGKIFHPVYKDNHAYMELINILEQERSICTYSWYTKNDFFTAIAKIADKLCVIKNL